MHWAAFCNTLEEFVRLGYQSSSAICTEKTSNWNVPRNKKVEPSLLRDLHLKRVRCNSQSDTTAAVTATVPRKKAAPSLLPVAHLLKFATCMTEANMSGPPVAFTHVLPPVPVLEERMARIVPQAVKQQRNLQESSTRQ